MSWVGRVKHLVNRASASSIPIVSQAARASKEIKRGARRRRYQARIRAGNVDFVTLDELADWTRAWIDQFSESPDLVVGVPRSGMIVASMIACRLGRPLTTPEGFRDGQWWSSRLLPHPKRSDFRSILLVDDSVDRGSSMAAAQEILLSVHPRPQITTAALIIHRREAAALVDRYYRFIAHPSIFEWNIMHAKAMANLSASLEGVLDHPGRRPEYPIDIVVAPGTEADRRETAEWLSQNAIQYKRLEFLGSTTKSEALSALRPDMHFENSAIEARKIWETTSIPTFAFETMELFGSLRP